MKFIASTVWPPTVSKRRSVYFSRLAVFVACTLGVYLPLSDPGFAVCNETSATITCSGDLADGVTIDVSDNSAFEQFLYINNIDTSIDGATGVQYYYLGQVGSDSAHLDAILDLYPYGIDGGENGISVLAMGGVGSHGADDTAIPPQPDNSVGTANGGTGHEGGWGGRALAVVDSGTISVTGSETAVGSSEFTSAISVASRGNFGGRGGNAHAGGFGGAAWAGSGGTGGSGLLTRLIIENNPVIINTSGAAHGITVVSEGAKGGIGGYGRSSLKDAAGGVGGTGGHGGPVDVSITASGTSVSTTGENATAISVESKGGDGGLGGNGSTGGIDTNAKGGDGGAGGKGGAINVDITASIDTQGDGAQGLFVKSYGGDGGNGGEGDAPLGRATGGGVLAAGISGAVDVNFDGAITTAGLEANALFVQSVGGYSASAGDVLGFVAYGASLQSGGSGNTVAVSTGSLATIATFGNSADGIFAQSQGGGGGKGSLTVGVVALGGGGSAGGSGKSVTVDSAGDDIYTAGERSRAIVANSTGGTGGDAGHSYAVVTIGSSSGKGGDGGDVVVTNSASLTTLGDLSDAIHATSIGGGGGSGHSRYGVVAIGGAGGTGGSGGNVSVFHSQGDISTQGSNAHGAILQSIGGGGGDASNEFSISLGFAIAIGASGGAASDGGAVSYDDGLGGDYSIATVGDQSDGIFAQSIGGGGGRSAYAISAAGTPYLSFALGATGDGGHGGDGDEVSVSSSADISTLGDHSSAVMAQSAGNGGGMAGAVVSVAATDGLGAELSLGGSGGAGGNGADVTATVNGNLKTIGTNAYGIFAESLGGGGGVGSFTNTDGILSEVSIAVGGDGGGGGDGAAVAVSGIGSISTDGTNSHGIFAHSIGGGGGSSGMSIADSIASDSFQLNIALGGDGGSAGSSGAVSVDYQGIISTSGDGSTAILAQSIPNGGGNASVTAAVAVGGSMDVSLAVGGNAGDGGTAGAVDVTYRGGILTTGAHAGGIRAESIGGSGGRAKATISANLGGTAGVSPTISVGGSGGSGGQSGQVAVQNMGAIATYGYKSVAISALSQGGSGGSGSLAASGSLLWSGDAIELDIGGEGGSGNTASDVEVDNEGYLFTAGDSSSGIVATSQGGDGGEGGAAISGAFSLTTPGSSQSGSTITISLGGVGGGGNLAGNVSVSNAGAILTQGHKSYGIDAQSLAGAGGRGGAVISAVMGVSAVSSTTTYGASIDIGGSGGDGNIGGDVNIQNSGFIRTDGHYSNAINAVSIGGMGGDGGSSLLLQLEVAALQARGAMEFGLNIGGNGGTGNDSGSVEIINEGVLLTKLGGAAGIFAQSVGGGGGKGGAANSVLINRANVSTEEVQTFSANFSVTVGGRGGSAGDGDEVSVSNYNSITTYGADSTGISAQSIGGGGGNAGSAEAMSMQTILPDCGDSNCSKASKGQSFEVNVVVGGTGGASGDGSTVAVINTGTIATNGSESYGIFAQSVGGGGGSGGSGTVGVSGWTSKLQSQVAADIIDDTVTAGGVVGDPASFYKKAEIAVGGSGGASGDGGDVGINNEGNITTRGDNSHAVVAQSIGGGGGFGGNGANALIGLLTLGGDATASGAGGDVTVSQLGVIQTYGDDAIGIFAQSTGGAGGIAGRAGTALPGNYDSQVVIFGIPTIFKIAHDYETSAGGAVVVNTTDAIVTTGKASHGIFAQSVGGGGGARELSSTDITDDEKRGAVGSTGKLGSADDVTVDAQGDIYVSGEGAVGIFAQSAAAGFGAGGTVSVQVGGDIYASGDDGRAIMVSASTYIAVDTEASIKIAVDEVASVRSGENAHETIALFYGSPNSGENVLTNYGTIESFDETAYVLRYDEAKGGLDINNHGVFNGSVSLADGHSHRVYNYSGGNLGLGDNFDIGNSGFLSNMGTLSAATVGGIGTSSVIGASVAQSEDGLFWVDFDTSGSSGTSADYVSLDQSGVSAVLAGGITGNILNTDLSAVGDSGSIAVLHAGTGTIDVSDLSGVNTLGVQYGFEKTASSTGVDETIHLTYEVDYNATGFDLGSGHRNLTKHLKSQIEKRMSGLTNGSGDEYAYMDGIARQLLNARSTDPILGYSPDLYFAPISTSFMSNFNFANGLYSCPAGGSRTNMDFSQQGECSWVQGTGRATDYSPSNGYGAYSEAAYAFTAGVQRAIGDNLFAGFAASYEYANLNGTLSSDGTANRFQVGGVLKAERKNWTFATSLTGGVSLSDFNRQIITPDGSVFVESSPKTQFISLGGLVSHEFEFGNNYLKPTLNGGITYLHQNAFSETGSALYGMNIGAANVLTYWINPSVELGHDFATQESAMRAFVSAGMLASTSTGNDLDVSFLASPMGEGFTIANEMPEVLADLEVGFDRQFSDTISLQLRGQALLGNDYSSLSGNAKLRIKF